MKLKYIFASIVAALTLVVSCTKEADSYLNEVKVSSSYLAFPANGGSVNMTVTATDSWNISELPEWISASTLSGSQGEANVTFTATAAEATRDAAFKIVCAGKTQLINVLQVTEAKEPEIISVAQALAAIKAVDKGDGGSYNVSGTFYVKGIVCRITEISPQYGNATYYISDDGKYSSDSALQIYRGLWLESGPFTKGDEFAIGDELTIAGQLMSYKGTPETVEKTAYVVAISKSLIGIDGVELLDVEEGEGITEFPLEGGRIKVNVKTKGDGFHVDIPSEAKSWLHIDDFGANYVTLAADANQGGDRGVSVTFTTQADGTTYSCEQSFTQKGAILEVSVAEFLAAPVSSTIYKITGVITSVANAGYGNVYVKDYSGEAYVYGIGAKGDFEASGLKEGDIVTLTGNRGEYKGSAQMTGGQLESFIPVTEADIPTVLAAADGAYFRVTGEVKSIANDTYGNVYLTDGTNDLYVYGTYPGVGASGDARKGVIAAEGIEVGDILTVFGPRSTYNGTPQINGGFFWSLEKGGSEEPDPEDPEEPEELGEFDTGVTCTPISSAYTDGVLNLTLGETTAENVFTLKLGTGSKYGSASITLPAGTKAVSYYAIAWKNNPATLKFSVGDSEIGTQAIAANDGATGSSPYTATISESDKYVFQLAEPLAADTDVIVETFEDETNKGYRAILFGIQAVK